MGWHGTLFANLDDVDGSGGGDAKDKKAVVQKAPDPRVKSSVFLESGITGNPNDPDDHQNFGRIFDDRLYNNLLATYKVTDKLNSITEGIYTCVAGFGTEFYNAAASRSILRRLAAGRTITWKPRWACSSS